MEPRMQVKYNEEVAPQLKEKFQYKSVMQVPKIEKIVLNQGLNSATSTKKVVDTAVQEMTFITGQKAVPTLAKQAISNFKLREGMPVGVKATLRREKMYEFLDRLISVALPRVRDFRGINDKSFDGRGNYTLGIQEQIIFPEIDLDKVDRINGMDITIVTSAKTDEEAYELLKLFGMPFRNAKNKQ